MRHPAHSFGVAAAFLVGALGPGTSNAAPAGVIDPERAAAYCDALAEETPEHPLAAEGAFLSALIALASIAAGGLAADRIVNAGARAPAEGSTTPQLQPAE